MGTKVGGLKCVTGISGKAMQFDGSTGYITVPNSTSLNPVSQWTMSFWVKAQQTSRSASPILHKGGESDRIIGANREYTVWVDKLPAFEQASGGDGVGQHYMYSPKISLAKWIHYVGVIDRVNHVMSIYLNGKKAAQIDDSYSSINNNTHDLRIGGMEEREPHLWPFFKGTLDDIRLYNRVLTVDEIAGLYNMSQPISGTTKGLQQINVTCTNTTTGQTVTIPTQTSTAWDCKKAGLKTQPNQAVNISVDGNTYP
ncbi:MAG: LamG domain-containing protein [Methylovulum sp.]|nr:LamG domain-containing protein [Methylovulum sp.]